MVWLPTLEEEAMNADEGQQQLLERRRQEEELGHEPFTTSDQGE
jgi:hypothetical protein